MQRPPLHPSSLRAPRAQRLAFVTVGPPARGRTTQGRWAALALAALGCEGTPIALGYGTLTEDHRAENVVGCGADERTIVDRRGATALSAAQHGVSRRLQADGEARVSFDFDVTQEVLEDAATLTLAAGARIENDRCGTGCEGASGRVQFVWTGAVSLPPAPRGYAVRVTVHAERDTSMGPRLFLGQCTVETPWRPAITVEAGDAVREVDAPAGEATIRVGCDRRDNTHYISLGCVGAATSDPPREQGLDTWSSALVRVKIDIKRRAD
jgi:hypothetical protein